MQADPASAKWPNKNKNFTTLACDCLKHSHINMFVLLSMTYVLLVKLDSRSYALVKSAQDIAIITRALGCATLQQDE